jgi:hypothetical protein
VIRIPAYVLLVVLEPFVSLALCFLIVASLGTAFIFTVLAHPPHFPLWGTLAFSVACAFSLALYHALIGLLARR